MILALAIALEVAFPLSPDPAQMAIGAKEATRHPKLGTAKIFTSPSPRINVDLIYHDDSRGIGSWANGTLQQTTETCLWLSPALMSRWLGFLQQREKLTDEAASYKWQQMRHLLDGNLTFVVRLSAFPKLPTLNIGDEEPANLADIDDVRFVIMVNRQQVEVSSHRLARWQARERKPLEDYRWWLDTPLAAVLNPEFEPDSNRNQLPLGRYHAAWYLITAPAGSEPVTEISVHILSQRKERVARWKSPEPRRPKKK